MNMICAKTDAAVKQSKVTESLVKTKPGVLQFGKL